MRRVAHAPLLALVLAASLPAPAPALVQQDEPLPSIAEKTADMERIEGFLPLYWDDDTGRIWIELRPGQELIYIESLTAGMGSNDIGLDRNQLGETRLVRFERVGPKVLMVQPNYDYRASTTNQAERLAVEEAFARSVLWGFEAGAETGERVLVDATDFVLRDAHDVVGALRATDQGAYSLDRSRSAVYMPRTRAFPRNSEIEATLTYTGERPGGWVRDVTPTPEAITVRQRHSFVALPEPGFEMRRSDPRAGYGGIRYADYATPIGEPVEQRFIRRHRLQKRDPSAPVSEAVEPIVYYLDPGVPEPVRSALLDGARWWNQAFEAAGYRDAFQVRMLPEDADPMDVRYNVINWVHRATRGWSYGSSVVDPRTGEIIKGHVALGSLRVRQDYLIAEGLLSPYETGTEVPPELAEMALARIRQLSAHEVGHTLGIAHNYISSTADRASVMDYPHPLVRLTADGEIDLSEAYDTGIGEWDEVSIAYGYQDFPEGTDEEAALDRILTEAMDRGLIFITDQDARPPGGAHPQAHLWDNGEDAAGELERMMRVRSVALDRFGERAIRQGMPLATMEEALVPLYLHHRYQIEAAAKVLGGKFYTFALRGDRQDPLTPVPADRQWRALDALLGTLDAAALALPREVIDRLPPRPFTYEPHRELFERYTGLTFDPIAPAAAAADMTVRMILHPQRAARLVEQSALHPELPGLGGVIERLVDATFDAAQTDPYEAEINRAVERVVLDGLMALAAEADMPQARAIASLELEQLRDRLQAEAEAADDAQRAHYRLAARDIQRFLDRPAGPWQPEDAPEPPPGSPIGSGDDHDTPHTPRP